MKHQQTRPPRARPANAEQNTLGILHFWSPTKKSTTTPQRHITRGTGLNKRNAQLNGPMRSREGRCVTVCTKKGSGQHRPRIAMPDFSHFLQCLRSAPDASRQWRGAAPGKSHPTRLGIGWAVSADVQARKARCLRRCREHRKLCGGRHLHTLPARQPSCVWRSESYPGPTCTDAPAGGTGCPYAVSAGLASAKTPTVRIPKDRCSEENRQPTVL